MLIYIMSWRSKRGTIKGVQMIIILFVWYICTLMLWCCLFINMDDIGLHIAKHKCILLMLSYL